MNERMYLNVGTADSTITSAGTQTDTVLRRRVGRFRERPGLRILRHVMGLLSRHAPTLATHVGYQLISRPTRPPERDWQHVLRSQAEVSQLPFGKGKLVLYSWGAGPTILMVHGWSARATHMGKMIMPLVDAGFRVLAFDGPAHGASTGKSTDLMQFSAAIRCVSDHAGETHAIIAHSFGGAMTGLAAHEFGIRCARLVLISSFDHCNWFCDAFRQYVGLSPEIMSRMQARMSERYGGRIQWEQLAVARMLRGCADRTLVMHDENDEEIPVVHARTLHESIPGASLHLTQLLGHHRLLGDAKLIARVVDFCRAAG